MWEFKGLMTLKSLWWFEALLVVMFFVRTVSERVLAYEVSELQLAGC